MSNFIINPSTFAKTETIIYSQTASGNNMITFHGTILVGGLCIKSGDSLIGESVTKVTFKLYKSGTPTATTLYARVFNTASALSVKHTFGSLAVSELTDTGVDFDLESASSYTLVANDVVGIYCDNSGSSHGDHVNQAGTSGSTSTLKYGDYDSNNTPSWSSTGNQRPYLIMIEIS